MRINVAVPEAHVDAPVLDAALESVTRLNESLIAQGHPTFEEGLKHGVRWKPEPPGAEHFDHAQTVLSRKWGDCDDLAPWHAASLRASGEDPHATAVVHRSGPKRWHAVVQRGDGRIDDPSRAAGMGRGVHGVAGATIPLMGCADVHGVAGEVGAFILRPQIAMRPIEGGWQARADLPWNWGEHAVRDKPSPADYAMTALHMAPTAHTALVGAMDGACQLGIAAGFAHPEHLDRLAAISDAVSGVPLDDVAAIYGDEHAAAAEQIVGSFFGHLGKIFNPIEHFKMLGKVVTDPKHALKHLMSPINSAMHLAQPLGHMLKPFAGMAAMVPGFGTLASAAINTLDRGSLPKNLKDMANFAMQQGGSLIPGASMLGPMAGMFGGGHPSAGPAQQAPFNPFAAVGGHPSAAQHQAQFNPFAAFHFG